MTTGAEVFRELQRKARADSQGTDKQPPTAEYLTRHGLESFLHRLTRTPHSDDFVLKGGILLAVYGARRPTKDIDAEAISASVTPDYIVRVVQNIAAVEADDGLVFNVDSIDVRTIREVADYPGLRVKVSAMVGNQNVVIAWDISTGQPIVPAPRLVNVPRLLGEPIAILGYAPETTVAEKGVTILERGITSTRWRDYVDIVRLAEQHDLDQELLIQSSQAVARYRGVALTHIGPSVAGYGEIAQAKWAAWRRKESVEDICEALLDDQMVKVADVLDPVFGGG